MYFDAFFVTNSSEFVDAYLKFIEKNLITLEKKQLQNILKANNVLIEDSFQSNLQI